MYLTGHHNFIRFESLPYYHALWVDGYDNYYYHCNDKKSSIE